MRNQEDFEHLQNKLSALKIRISKKKDLAKICNLDDKSCHSSIEECVERITAEQIFISIIAIVFERNKRILLDKNTMRANMRQIIAKRMEVNDDQLPERLKGVALVTDYINMIDEFFGQTLRYFKNSEEILTLAIKKAEKSDNFSSKMDRPC